MKKIYLLLFCNLWVFIIYAQSDFQFSQQSFMRIAFNPAVTGKNPNYHTLQAFSRMQWVGFDNAPITNFATFHSQINKYHLGLGLTYTFDKLGVETSNIIQANVSYHLNLGNDYILSFGMSGGLYRKVIDINDIELEQPESNLFDNNIHNSPDFNAGIEFSSPYISIGISSTHIAKDYKNGTNFQIPRHVYGYFSAKVFDIKNSFAGFLTYSLNSAISKTQHEWNATFFYKNMIYTGLSYRLNESFVIMAGVLVKDKFRFIYSYDILAAPISAYSSGSHEITLQYLIKKKNASIPSSPRYFD
ncbi:MAG TPA: PorP/SprF family type IX secretion system membrane protein [Bacteroidales bacterium]|nr:PorP/SprF family type IX secretion system membrane protein [Bacteroidales bacterium]